MAKHILKERACNVKLDGNRHASVDGYASTYCDLDLLTYSVCLGSGYMHDPILEMFTIVFIQFFWSLHAVTLTFDL